MLAARGPEVLTPLAHWALPWAEWQHLPEALRSVAGRCLRVVLSRKVRVPGGFSFSGKWSWRDASDLEDQRRLWRGLRDLSPQMPAAASWRRLLEHCPGPGAVRVRVISPHWVRFILLLTLEEEPLAYARRYWEPRRRHVEHALIAVARNVRERGVGAQILANSLAFYKDLNIRTVGLTAGLTAGGAVWPLFGFRPATHEEWTRVKTVIRANYLKLPVETARAYEGGPNALQSAVDAILEDPHPDGIWSVVDLDPDRIAARAGRLPHSLGGWLLQGSRWRGVLDLGNDIAVERARYYISDRLTKGVIKKPFRW